MKKRIVLFALVLLLALALSACGCKHETWIDADCETPKTCAECGETEGAPLGHTWNAATCDTAKTCAVCAKTEGEALGHSWVDADCENPKTCSACSLTEGEALGHSWVEATTEAPKTCTNCAKTEGERIITDPRFTTAACAPLFGKWQAQIDLPGSALDAALAAYVDVIPVLITFDFHNDGSLNMTMAAADEEQLSQVMYQYTVDLMYQEFTSMGLSADEANAAMLQAYGMSVEDYVSAAVQEMDFNELFSAFSVDYVYYVEGDQMYLGFSWETMEADTYSLEGDTLMMPVEGDEPVAFTRVAE